MDEGIIPEINYDDLTFYECLSSGAYGTVYRAQWLSRNRVVAVKKVLVLEKEVKLNIAQSCTTRLQNESTLLS